MLLASRPRAVAFPDAHPVSPGHCLVVPRRHQPDFFQLSREEQEDMWDIVWELRELLEAEHDTTSYNVGVNAGEAAGQIVAHAHVHVIPRYEGDPLQLPWMPAPGDPEELANVAQALRR